jgi:hypothetical protein
VLSKSACLYFNGLGHSLPSQIGSEITYTCPFALPEAPERIAEIVEGHAMVMRSVRLRDHPPGDRYSDFE